MRWICVFSLLVAQSLVGQQFVRPGLLPQTSEWPKPLAEHFALSGEVLVSALNTRAAALTNFAMPQVNVGWSLRILRLAGDTYIFSYTPPAGFTFNVQAIDCERKSKFLDFTILGPTETAAEFYDANLHFLMISWKSEDLSCAGDAHLTGEIEFRPTEIPGTNYVTSRDRVIRHLCYWFRYFMAGKGVDPKRAADFLVIALDKHKEHLLDLETQTRYSEISRTLDLFDKQFPDDGFDAKLPLDSEARAHVRSYLETTIRIRRKLRLFIPNPDARIRQDEALLARFR